MKDWRNRRAAGSLTVEASFVMGILLFSMAVLLRFSFSLHDQVVGNAVLNEGMELLGHSEEDSGEDLSRRGTRRMEQGLSGRGFRIELSREGTGVRGTAGGERRSTEMRDKGFHPEEFLRRVTLLEAAADRLGEN